MKLSICSYSFHRLLAAGEQDIFKYITDCKELGCTHLDPWNSHFAPLKESDIAFKEGRVASAEVSPQEKAYLEKVKEAAGAVGMPFGCIAVDGAHIYEPTEAARRANRALAYKWLDVAGQLGTAQVRIDAGGPPEMPDDVFAIIVEGYHDVIARAREKGIEVLVENHWGPTNNPDNVVRLMEAVDGLGLLFDTNNWIKERQEEAWNMCAKYARASHVKTFCFDEEGNEPTVDIPKVMHILLDTGFDGVWGIESVPREVDEYEGVKRTIALMKRVLGEA
ncbi:MAG: sugar phosphate isomerase/epimerase [Anaerolineae bacterium]|nr:sugar phosphate isomerase/epimerase [Anaerolineae bacterium]